MIHDWETSEADVTVHGNSSFSIYLKRNGAEFSVTVYNYSDNGCTASAAYVEKLSSNDLHGEFFAITEGLNTDLSEDELLDYLQNHNLAFTQSHGAFGNKYIIQLEGTEWNNYCVISCNENGIEYISISSGNS